MAQTSLIHLSIHCTNIAEHTYPLILDAPGVVLIVIYLQEVGLFVCAILRVAELDGVLILSDDGYCAPVCSGLMGTL